MRFGLLLGVMWVAACGEPKRVERVSESAVTDVSEYWNDTDSRLVADEMVRDCLTRPWLQRATQSKKGAPPTIIVQTIRNRSSEHIATQTFTKDLERALVNDGRVEFVASKSERQEIREERADQADNSTDDSAKSAGKEAGADYALQGTINSIIATEGGTQVRFYQVDLELISVSDNRKAWINSKKIKKVVNRKSTSW
jgi:penicillin-binding protein activator